MTYRRDLLPKLQNAQQPQQGITEVRAPTIDFSIVGILSRFYSTLYM